MNESLLIKILDHGAGDTMPIILNHVTSLKEKVRLERVCRSFRKHARTFLAWSSIKCIDIIDCPFDNNIFMINDDKISAQYFESAIESILHRTRNVRLISLECCERTAVYFLITRSITEYGTNRKVQQLILDGYKSPDISTYILLLLEALKNQLTALLLDDVRFADVSDMKRLWNIIGECVNLKSFSFWEYYHYMNKPMVTPEMVKEAMRGKAICKLGMVIPCIDTVNFIEILSSFSDPRLVQQLTCCNRFSLVAIAQHLPLTVDNIQEITYYYHGSITETSPDWDVILRLPYFSSHLTKLVVIQQGEFREPYLDLDMSIELIVSYLVILNKRESATDFKLRIYSKAFDQYDDTLDDWNKVRDSLIMNHRCQIEPPNCWRSYFRVRNGTESRASIEIIDRIPEYGPKF